MKLKLLLAVLLLTSVFCITTTALAMTDSERQALITQIQQEIAQLMEQLAQLQAEQDASTTSWCHTFNTNLGFANSGSDEVSQLHTALQKENISYGSDDESTYAEDTAAAVVQFQAKYGISPQSGYAGPLTIVKLNKLYGCTNITPMTTCTSFTYTGWSECNSSGIRTRTVTSSVPSGCTGGNLATSEACASSGQPYIKVLSPNGGESWEKGKTYNITWESSGIDKVTIKLLNGSTSNSYTIATNVSASLGSYSWTLISALNTSATDKIFIYSEAPGVNTAVSDTSDSDTSDNNFSIVLFNTCTPHMQCASWGACINGFQSRKCTDSNNCSAPPSWAPWLWIERQPCVEEQSSDALACTQDSDCVPNKCCHASGTTSKFYFDYLTECLNAICVDTCEGPFDCGKGSPACISGQCSIKSTCTPNWVCENWSFCNGGQQGRYCSDKNNCGVTTGKPSQTQSCQYNYKLDYTRQVTRTGGIVVPISTPEPCPPPPTAQEIKACQDTYDNAIQSCSNSYGSQCSETISSVIYSAADKECLQRNYLTGHKYAWYCGTTGQPRNYVSCQCCNVPRSSIGVTPNCVFSGVSVSCEKPALVNCQKEASAKLRECTAYDCPGLASGSGTSTNPNITGDAYCDGKFVSCNVPCSTGLYDRTRFSSEGACTSSCNTQRQSCLANPINTTALYFDPNAGIVCRSGSRFYPEISGCFPNGYQFFESYSDVVLPYASPGCYAITVPKTNYVPEVYYLCPEEGSYTPTPIPSSCTESNWTYTLSPSTCPSSGQQTKTWAKIGSCTGGVSHPSAETVSCTYQASTCTSFTYTNWSECNSSGTRTRTVVSSLPWGCTGGDPVVSESCVSTPECTEADWIYTLFPSTCPSTGEQTKTWTNIGNCEGGASHPSIETVSCTYQSSACTSFTYTNWSECNSSGTRTRTVTSSLPWGCTGGNPATSESCTLTPLCTEANWTYILSPWVCPSSGQQTKTWTNIGSCSGGVSHPLIETVSCTYQASTCTSFTYTNWSECNSSGTRTRTVISSFPSWCTGGNPVTSESCTYTSACTESNWTYTLSPSTCPLSGQQTKTWAKVGSCTGGVSHPSTETVSCTYQSSACTSFTYTNWSECNSSGTRTRTVTSSLPWGCTGGNPVVSESCTIACTPNWQCGNWGGCQPSGLQYRTCTDFNSCNTLAGKPEETQSCTAQKCFDSGRYYETGGYDCKDETKGYSNSCFGAHAIIKYKCENDRCVPKYYTCSGNCQYGTCYNGVETGEYCNDSDGWNFSNKGTCADSLNPNDVNTDYCSGSTLREWQCERPAAIGSLTCTIKEQACQYGCSDGKCLNCVPNCTNKQCGDNGCGTGFCGYCSSGQTCRNGLCISPSVGEKSCTTAKDCVAVGCTCTCSGCGGFSYQDVVNKNYQEDWYNRHSCSAPLICPQVCCPARQVVCENNTCVVK